MRKGAAIFPSRTTIKVINIILLQRTLDTSTRLESRWWWLSLRTPIKNCIKTNISQNLWRTDNSKNKLVGRKYRWALLFSSNTKESLEHQNNLWSMCPSSYYNNARAFWHNLKRANLKNFWSGGKRTSTNKLTVVGADPLECRGAWAPHLPTNNGAEPREEEVRRVTLSSKGRDLHSFLDNKELPVYSLRLCCVFNVHLISSEYSNLEVMPWKKVIPGNFDDLVNNIWSRLVRAFNVCKF